MAKQEKTEVRKRKIEVAYIQPEMDQMISYRDEKTRNRYKAKFDFFCNVDIDLYEQSAYIKPEGAVWWENTVDFLNKPIDIVRGNVLPFRLHREIHTYYSKMLD